MVLLFSIFNSESIPDVYTLPCSETIAMDLTQTGPISSRKQIDGEPISIEELLCYDCLDSMTSIRTISQVPAVTI